MSERFNKIDERTSPTLKRRVALSFDISERILDILEQKNLSQKDLANRLGKSESEISKWMKGDHNFTLDTIAKIEIALEERIIDIERDYKAKLAVATTALQRIRGFEYVTANIEPPGEVERLEVTQNITGEYFAEISILQ